MASWTLLFGIVALSAIAAAQQATVKIPQGTLKGVSAWSAEGKRFYKFLGIPYAKPPLGNLRFAAPQEPESWSGERNASDFGSMCVQETGGGAEDCLFVNVFTPQVPTSKNEASLLPVLVYIHGGAFAVGSGNISPGQMIDRGLVMVSINYRLNVFGFLRVDNTDAPGNAGLKDQVAALRWIQKNIASFGGDPNSVTIDGGSAGGASVHYHILSPMSKGLFHRAISESATAMSYCTFINNTNDRSYRLSSILGKEAHSAAACIENLRAASANDLMNALSSVLTADESVRLVSVPFLPSQEFHRSEEQVFLPHEPQYLEEHGLFNDVPYIAGATSREAAYFLHESSISQASYWQAINNDLERVVPVDLGLTKGSQKSKEVAQKVKTFYFGNDTISYDTREKWVNLQTDFMLVFGIVRMTHLHTKYSTHTYNYYFTYGTALHCAEAEYVFYDNKIEGQTSDAAKLASVLGSLWSSFAKTGVPSATGVTWNAASQSSYQYLEINLNSTLKNDIEKDRMNFWFDIYKNYSNYTATL